MLNVLLHHVNGTDTKIIQMAAETPLWAIFRHVRSNYPSYCFYESWLGEERGSGRLAA